MQYPAFYDNVQTIILFDPLSDFLGAFEEGIMEISYLDCVKLAGHSCPTVAGAYLMALIGLKSLFQDTLPRRGLVKVSLSEAETEDVTGVIGNVIGFITGAAGKGGFKGIQGKFPRNDLLTYGETMDSEVTLTRIDNKDSVTLRYDPSSIPADVAMKPLMGKMLQGIASKEEAQVFGKLWQQRVEQILLNETSWNNIITIKRNKI